MPLQGEARVGLIQSKGAPAWLHSPLVDSIARTDALVCQADLLGSCHRQRAGAGAPADAHPRHTSSSPACAQRWGSLCSFLLSSENLCLVLRHWAGQPSTFWALLLSRRLSPSASSGPQPRLPRPAQRSPLQPPGSAGLLPWALPAPCWFQFAFVTQCPGSLVLRSQGGDSFSRQDGELEPTDY